jgi:hypothetical protein
LILESEGGILADLNFSFNQNFLIQNINSYDFVAQSRGFPCIENSFFIAKPHHVIFKELLNIIEEMMFSNDCALNQLRNGLDTHSIADTFSMLPLYIANIMYSNQDGNRDAHIYNWSKCPEKKIESFPASLLEEFNSHDNLENYIDSTDANHHKVFIDSYLSIVYQSLYGKYDEIKHCIEPELIGEDGLDETWMNDNIFNLS